MLTGRNHCRPTASQLLKDPFFKKAKTKDSLVEVLATAPSLTERARKVRASHSYRKIVQYLHAYQLNKDFGNSFFQSK